MILDLVRHAGNGRDEFLDGRSDPPQLAGLPVLLYQSLDDEVVPLSNGVRLYQAAPPPRVLQLTRGGHVQTFADPTWRQVMLRFLDDPSHFNGLRRLAEVPNFPDEKNKQ